MREILFRGKRLDNNEWVYGDLENCKIRKKTLIHTYFDDGKYHCQFEVDPSTVGQYTSLTDKSGTKIFEGDIIKTKFSKSIVKFGEYQHINARSGYRNGDLGFYVYHIDKSQRDCERNDLLYFNEQCEVVGNIFDSNLDGGNDEQGKED